jgi:hypothetical protein
MIRALYFFGEAESAGKLVELFVRSLEAGEFDRRIRALEEIARRQDAGRAEEGRVTRKTPKA